MSSYLEKLSYGLAMFFWVCAPACGSHSIEGTDGGTAGIGGATASGGTGGAAGSGAGSGGVGGGGGSAGAGGTGIVSDSGTCGCVTGHVGWGMDGGLVVYQETNALEICSVFSHQRMSRAPGPPVLFCEQDIGACPAGVSAGDVTRAIANADVQAAIAAAPVLYGEDPRAYDGQVLRIQIGSAVIEVGVPCRVAGCRPIPAGVQSLGTLLQTLTREQLAREPCKSIFPPAPCVSVPCPPPL
jgi:hypothetical protein